MILNRLHELAVRKQLMDDPAFESQSVPFIVLLDTDGKFLGIDEQRGEVVTVKKTRNGETVKRSPDAGIKRLIPRPHGNTASQGFARYFVDTLPRVIPVAVDERDRAKFERSRTTFWEQIDNAADETDDIALRTVQAFGRQLVKDAALREQVAVAVAARKPGKGDRVSFAYHGDGGKLLLDREVVRNWFAAYYQKCSGVKQDAGPVGFCTVTGTVGPLPTSHAFKLKGIPGGLPTGVSIVSFDKAAFRHYELDGAANAAIGYQGADGYARAFQWLQGQKKHHFIVGDTLFLFWTRRDASTDFVMSLDDADPAQIRNLFDRLAIGQAGDGISASDDFYLLAVSGNSARAIVRDYLERPVEQVRASIRQWYSDLRIADTSKDYHGQPNAAFPMWMLAAATAFDAKSVAPDTQARLVRAALSGESVPESLLIACVRRLRAEGSEGFRPNRMALIKLILKRKEIAVTEALNQDERHPAYLCGRLLSVFEQIQYDALGDVNANVVDKFYGTFSAAPALVFSRLVANAQNHLRKLRGEKPGAFVNDDRRLGEVLQMLGASPPPTQFSLHEQGRFALGYYHEKAKRFEGIAQRKAEKAAKTENK